MKGYTEKNATMLLAINFDQNTKKLLQSGIRMAKSSQLSVKLVHVLSPTEVEEASPITFSHDPDLSFYQDYRVGNIMSAAHKYTREYEDPSDPFAYDDLNNTSQAIHASARLKQLCETMQEQGIDCSTKVLFGHFPTTVLEYAQYEKAALIMTGACMSNPGVFGRKIRSVKHLMTEAQTPVLIVPDNTSEEESLDKVYRILIADDLSDESATMIDRVNDFVSLLGLKLHVHHVHITPSLQVGDFYSDETGLSYADAPTEAGGHGGAENIKGVLLDRAVDLRKTLDLKGGSYTADVYEGEVQDKIEQAKNAAHPDLCIFGKHHGIHLELIKTGQMSFRSMLNLGGNVMVMP